MDTSAPTTNARTRMRTLRGEAIALAMRKNAAAAAYQDLASAQASERSLAQAIDSVSQTSSRPMASIAVRSSAPTRRDLPRAFRVAIQPSRSTTVAITGALPVTWEYSIHAIGTHAAIASGTLTRTSVANAHAPTRARPALTSRASTPPAIIATTIAIAASGRWEAALRMSGARRAPAAGAPDAG